MLTKLAFGGLVVSVLGLVAACGASDGADGSSSGASSSGSSGDSGDSGTSSSSGSSGSSGDAAAPDANAPAGATTVVGTIIGKPFDAKSGFGFVDKGGALDLVLSSEEGLCELAEQAKLRAGETLVQLYTLKGAAPGAFTPENDDVKFASVKATCASGAPLSEMDVEAAARATSTTVTIAALTGTAVEGTLSITFDDGSSVSGEFDVPICSTTMPECLVCD